MGSVISKAADGVGDFLGSVLTAPFKNIFGGSCQDVCSGAWDVVCFIEHLCVSNLVKLLMILGLCYLLLLFFYLLFKVGIVQCIVKSLCKMCCAACETYWFALEDITCFLWHKLKNTKRINRRRRRRFHDIERGYTSSSSPSDFSDGYGDPSRKRKSISKYNRHSHHHHHHHVRLKSREVSVHVKGRSRRLRSTRRLQLVKLRNRRRDPGIFKRRRLR